MSHKPEPDLTKMGEAVVALQDYTEGTFGLFHDALAGWSFLGKQVEAILSNAVQEGKTREQALALTFSYIKTDGGQSMIRLHQSTFADVLDRCRQEGPNEREQAKLCLVAINSYWEMETRGRIADACGVPYKGVLSQLFYEVCKLRNWALHSGKAESAVTRFKLLRWFAPGDEIVIDRHKLFELVEQVRKLPDGLVITSRASDLANPNFMDETQDVVSVIREGNKFELDPGADEESPAP